MVDMHAVLFVLAFAVLLPIVVAVVLASVQRWQMRRSLGLPQYGKLGDHFEHTLHAFEATEVQLTESFPNASKGRRQTMARKILRDQGLLPRTTSDRVDH